MNSATTVDVFHTAPETAIPATGAWIESYGRPRETFSTISRLARSTGLLLCLVASSITAMADPWLTEKRRRDAVVTVSIYQEVIGRPISRFEALQLASQILQQAEWERIDYSDFEAARGIQWGDET